MNNSTKIFHRKDLITVFVVLSVITILFRCFTLQYTESEKYANLIEGAEIKKRSILTSRGSIVDRNNNILAQSLQMDSLIINDTRKFYENKDDIIKMCNFLDMTYKSLIKKTNGKENKKYIRIKRHLSPEVVDEIKKLNLSGVYFQKEMQRFYPEGEVLAPLIGRTNYDHEGQMGLELSFDKHLSEENGLKIVKQDGKGEIVKEIRLVRQPKEGKKLVLTIDKRLQYVAYRELKNQVINVNAKAGSVVVLDSTNGDILAIANYPSYDPHLPGSYSDEKSKNRAIIESIEPASTIKPFVLAAGLHSEKISLLNSKYDTSSGLRVGNYSITDWKNLGDNLTAEDVVVFSSNIGSVKIAQSFNKKIYYNLLKYVGVGEKIDINFPAEQDGQLNHYSDWGKTELANHAYGYALKTTPLQLAKAYAVIANEGQVINPEIIKDQNFNEDKTKKYEDSFKKVKSVLKKVVTKGGGSKASVEGYSVGGKTGTAKAYVDGKYTKEHISIFSGMTPVEKTKLIIVVVINEPRTKEYYGSDVAAPVFKKIATDSLRILNISPDNTLDFQKKVSIEIENSKKYTFKNPEVRDVF